MNQSRINREDRNWIAAALRLFLDSKINNFELIDRISFKTDDLFAAEIIEEIDDSLSEFREHYSVSETMTDGFERFVSLLLSDYRWVPADEEKSCCVTDILKRFLRRFKTKAHRVTARTLYWPFASREEWESWAESHPAASPPKQSGTAGH